MPAPVAARPRDLAKSPKAARAARPPIKKTKLSQPPAPQLNGLKTLLNGTPDSRSGVAAKINGVRNVQKGRVEEAAVVVGGGPAGHGDVEMADADGGPIIISSAEEESEYSSLDEEADDDAEAGAEQKNFTNGADQSEDRPAQDGPAEPEELSFGERLQAQDSETMAPQLVDVEAAFADDNADARALAATSSSRPLSAPSASSLGTVLSQALRTNDQDLLDSCLRIVDVDTVRATVERLPSPLVGNLLQKLAERLHRRPGRAGMLMLWVQWSLAAHGGYLATQPQLVKQLATLNKVLKERASGLQPLLSLKGRLDMLNAQLELRRRNQKRATRDEDDEVVVYVEGEDDYTSADDAQSDDDSDVAPSSARKRTRQAEDEAEEVESEDEMPTTMEVDEADSDEESEDSEGMLDDEAEETENDTGDDMSEPMSDDELVDGEDVSESEEDSRPARRSTIGRAGLSRRP